MDELELDLTEDQNINNKTEQRIKGLAAKVQEKANEAETERKAREEAEAAKAEAEKRVEFLQNFSDVASKYQGASEHRSDIEAKVLAGYSVEDATVSVLNAAGKLMPQVEQAPVQQQAAGGSASIELPAYADKQIGEMTREEMRAALVEADQNGELRKVLKY